jgi:ubiquinone/menaquinone biosynthesis C-methylase UbiE
MAANNVDPVVEEYAKAADRYDEKWSFYVEATTRETLKRLVIPPAARILDVGCGTGELLLRLAARHPDSMLSGIDPVPAMLQMAERKLPGRVDFRVGYASALPWPDASFDVVVSCNMFHYVTQPLLALQEMHRVLRPGGSLVITDWCDDYLMCRLCNVYLRLTNRAYYKTYKQRECLDLLSAAGTPVTGIERYKISWLWGLMTATVQKSLPAD